MKARRISPVLRILGPVLILGSAIGWQQPSPRALAMTTGASRQAVMKAFGKLPMIFEANQGQTDSQVKFLARGPGYAAFLASTKAVLVIPYRAFLPASLEPSAPAPAFPTPSTSRDSTGAADAAAVIRMQLVGANASPRIVGLEALAGRTNYLHGDDPARWQTAVPQFARVHYEDVYPGVDLVYYGQQGRLEHDFLVAPGANSSAITLRFQGADQMEIDERGDLVLHISSGRLRLPKPHIYQSSGSTVAGGYVIKSKREVGFEVGPYDHGQPLVLGCGQRHHELCLGLRGWDDGLGCGHEPRVRRGRPLHRHADRRGQR